MSQPTRPRGRQHDGRPPLTRRALLAAGTVYGLLAAGCSASDNTPPPSPAPLPAALGHQVWAHYIGQGLPNWDSLDSASYGDHYYLDLVHGGPTTAQRPTAGVPRAKAAGLTGMQVLLGAENSGGDFVDQWFAQADPTWRGSTPGFRVAPAIADTDPSTARRLLTEYAAAAKGHASAARVGDALVVFTYGGRHHMSPSEWSAIRTKMRSAGTPVYLVGDILPEAALHGGTLPSADILPYLEQWDASWLFEADELPLWSALQKLLAQAGRPFLGGVMPGYNRETDGSRGADIDPRGTRKFREEWENILTRQVGSQVVNTWNDLVEQTEIVPTSTWNATRSDINAFYSRKLRGVTGSGQGAQSYLTTPKFVGPKDEVAAEALVLNESGEDVVVTVEVFDPVGTAVLLSASARVAPGTASDATTRGALPRVPSRGFVRARATMRAVNGRLLQAVTSAPVLVFGDSRQVGSDLRRTYYSIPARASLPGTVRLTASGRPASHGKVTVTGPGRARFLEILQNTRLLARGFDSGALSATMTAELAATVVGGQRVRSGATGFYVGRVIDEHERVGYSDPITIPR